MHWWFITSMTLMTLCMAMAPKTPLPPPYHSPTTLPRRHCLLVGIVCSFAHMHAYCANPHSFRDLIHHKYIFDLRGPINVKGKGIMTTYFLVRPRVAGDAVTGQANRPVSRNITRSAVNLSDLEEGHSNHTKGRLLVSNGVDGYLLYCNTCDYLKTTCDYM